MELLDIVEDIRPCFTPGSILSAIYSLPPEQAKEALRCCVVGTTTYRTHAANKFVRLQEKLVLITGKLTSVIRVQNDRGFRLMLPQDHEYGL